MAVPTIADTGAAAVDVGPITPEIPGNAVVDDILLLIVRGRPNTTAFSIANSAGGLWTQVGFQHAQDPIRMAVYWSRYNGSQTAPTTNDVGDHQYGVILAIRGCITTGDPIGDDQGEAPIFAQTSSSINSVTTPVAECLVLNCIASSGPDADGTGVFSSWTNANLTSITEVLDASSATGAGGALGIASGTKATAGATGITTVTHAEYVVAYKQIAFIPATTPTVPTTGITVATNASGQVTIDGIPIFVRGIYDAGFAGSGGSQDMAGHVAARNLSRFTDKLNLYLHYQSGTFDNGLRLADALDPLHMYTLAIGNAAYDWGAGASGTVQGNSNANGPFDVVDNSNNFRFNFAGKDRAAAVYLFDETREDALTDLATWQTTYTTAMPNLATYGVSWHVFIDPIQAYAESTVGDWLAADPYPIGAAAENAPGGTTNTWGYSNYDVGHTAAAVRYYGLDNGKAPMLVLQAFKFGTASRYITNSEMWSHMVAVVAEGCVGVWWWAMGTGQGALHTSAFTSTERERVLAQIESMSGFLAQIEPALLSPSNPALLTTNSSSTGNAIQWRKDLLSLLDDSGGPTWFEAVRQTFITELAALNQGTPDTSKSVHVLDQSGDVRTRCWEYGGLGYCFAYNLHPNQRLNVTLGWHTIITRVEVVNESRDCTVINGTSWIDSFGGSSSLRQGSYNQGHVYRLYLTGTPTPPEAPVVTAVSVNSPTSVTIGLTAGVGATSHALYRSTTPNFSASTQNKVTDFGPTVTTLYIDENLAPATTYYYKLAATNAIGTTLSTETSISTGSTPTLIATFGATVPTTFVDSNLQPDTNYYYRMVAATPWGALQSNDIAVRTLTAPFPVGGGTVFVYYVLGENQLRSTTDIADAIGPDRAVMAVYAGGTGLITNWGKALIHGSDILTGTIAANQLVADSAVITNAAQIDVLTVNNQHVKDVSASKLTAGVINSQILIGSGKIASADTGPRVEIKQDALDVFDTSERSVFRVQSVNPFVRIGRLGGAVPPLQVSAEGDITQLISAQLEDLTILRLTNAETTGVTRRNPDNTAPAEAVLATYTDIATSRRDTDTIGIWWRIAMTAVPAAGSPTSTHNAIARLRQGSSITSPLVGSFLIQSPVGTGGKSDNDVIFYHRATGAARSHTFCLTGQMGGETGVTMDLNINSSRLMLLSRSA